MKNLFERTSSYWVRYSEYEWRTAEDGTLYLIPTKTAQPSIYDPLTEYQGIVLDAINIGRMGMSKEPDAEEETMSTEKYLAPFFPFDNLDVQMMLRFMLTDSENPIKLCKHCTKAFVASRPSAVFCNPQCKNKHNVYKSRAKKNSTDEE